MKTTVSIIILTIMSFAVNSQTEFKTEVSKDAVMKGEPFIITYKLNQNFDNFTLSENKSFEIISGPATSMQQSINMTNGKIEKSVSISYTYYLKAVEAGNYSLPVAEVKINGEYYYSESKEIIVIDADYRNPNEDNGEDIEGTSRL